MSIKTPEWLGRLAPREEKQRAAAGLTPKKDGWYKSVNGRTRYLFKPMPLRDALDLAGDRVAQIRRADAGDGGELTTAAALPPAALTVEKLMERYVKWLLDRLRTGMPKKLTRRTYDDIVGTLARFIEAVGPQRPAHLVGPDDFSRFARARFTGRATSTRRREIIYIESFFNWAGPGRKSTRLLPAAVDYGPDWIKPADHEIAASAADSDKAYTPEQLRAAFAAVRDKPVLHAAGHLALNGAFGPMDLGTLPEALVDLDRGLILFARGKTSLGRACGLVPETVAAVRAYLKVRSPRCDPTAEGLLFRTPGGLPYVRYKSKGGEGAVDDNGGPVPGREYNGLGHRWRMETGLPLSGLRSTFATLADDYADQRAVDLVMGHRSKQTIRSRHYAKKFKPDRVRALCEHVWRLAFGRTDPTPRTGRPPADPDAPPEV